MKRVDPTIRRVLSILITGIVFGWSYGASSAGKSSHTVTIRIKRINKITLKEGNSTDTLQWDTDLQNKKITVSSYPMSESPGIRVQAVHCEGGIPNGLVSVIDVDQDFVTPLSRNRGHCGLNYYLSKSYDHEQKNGEPPRITYTITDR
jgi:hypothetical protein